MAQQQTVTTPALLAEAERQVRVRSLWGDAFRRLIRNRLALAGGIVVLVFAAVAVLAPLAAPYDYAHIFTGKQLAPPSPSHWLGVDLVGRDTLSRVIYGARTSLGVGLFTSAIVVVIGSVVGGVAALGGKYADNLLMRFTDMVYAFPDLLFIILLQAVLSGTGLGNVMGGLLVVFLAIGMVNWVTLARIVRGQMLSLRERDYVLAARALGATRRRIVVRHLLPNTLSPVIVVVTFAIPQAIFLEAALSFIGVGVRPPTASWGNMIYDGYASILATPWPILSPALALAITFLAFTFLGDGLRDALDPRTR